jgi:Calpain family cysteine protease
MFRIWNRCFAARLPLARGRANLAHSGAFGRHRAMLDIELLESRITPSKLTLLPLTVSDLSLGQKAHIAFAARNGNGHYSYKLVSGELPRGLKLARSGVLSGEASAAGTYDFAVRVTDPGRRVKTATGEFSLTVTPADAVLTPPAGSVTQFAIAAPQTAEAGNSFYISVRAENSAGNAVVGYTGNATLMSSDGQNLHMSGPLVFSMGLAQAAVTLDTVDTVVLAATSGTISGTTGEIANGPGVASDFVVQAPRATTTGVPFAVTVTAEDAYGNPISNYDGAMTLTTSDGQSLDLSAKPVFTNGTAVLNLALTKPDQLTITATANGVAGTSNTIINESPQVSKFVVSAPATATAGVAFPVTVTAEDLFGDTVTGFEGTVTLTGSDGQSVILQSPLSFSDGMAATTVSLTSAGTLTLIARSGTAQGTSASIAVSPGTVSAFSVSAPTAALVATGFTVTVTAEDSFGNTVTGFGGSATMTSSDGQPVDLLSPMVFANGTAEVNVALDTPDTVTLTAATGAIEQSSGSIVVSPPPTTFFAVDAAGAVTAGVPFSLTVTARDDSGQDLTNFDGAVTLRTSDGQPVHLLAPLVFSDGIAMASVVLDTADTLTITAASGTMTGTSSTISTSPAAASRFIIAAPTTATVGIGFAVAITAEDAFGNVEPGFSALTTIASSNGGGVVLLSSPVFSNGVATVNAALNSAGTVSLTAASGAINGASGAIVVSARSIMNDWFSQNMSDLNLQDLARADFDRDTSLTYSDMLGLFAEAESEGALSAAALQSLQALVTPSGAAAVNMSAAVQSLAYKVVDGNPANAQYGDLAPGSSSAQLQDLVDQWFLGEDLPTIDMSSLSGESVSYAPASGTLFGSGGPSYKDVAQGEEGDCWLLAAFAETAAVDPSVIQSMFTDDGTALENGVEVHIWTVRFYDNGVTSYLTVNNELPAENGDYVYAGGFQSINASTNVLWVPLLEKAYAQLSASGWNGRPPADAYTSLNSGDASTALPVITGVAESSSYAFESASSFAEAVGAGTLMTLASFADSSGSSTNSLGVVPNHDYAVLSYDAANQTFALLNPWGWNNTNAPGILNLTWTQITQNFYLDGNCSTVS